MPPEDKQWRDLAAGEDMTCPDDSSCRTLPPSPSGATLRSLLTAIYSAGAVAEELREHYSGDGCTSEMLLNACLDLQHCAENVRHEITVLERYGEQIL